MTRSSMEQPWLEQADEAAVSVAPQRVDSARPPAAAVTPRLATSRPVARCVLGLALDLTQRAA